VTFPKAGTYPFFCQVLRPGHEGRDHRRVGRRLRGPTTTAASGAGSNVALVTTPKAAVPRSAGKPAIYWAGWGLFAVGALLALMLIALYVRFTPGFNRQKRA
jgi:hypothetical protein